MRVQVQVSLSPQRLTARTSDGTVWIDEPNLVALGPAPGSLTTKILAIGSVARSQTDVATVVPGFSVDDFDPSLTARVIEWAAKFAWSRRRPQFKGFIAVLDRVDVHVEIVGYEALPSPERQALMKCMAYHPQIRWWLEGERYAIESDDPAHLARSSAPWGRALTLRRPTRIVGGEMDTDDEGRTIPAIRLKSDCVAILDQVDKMNVSYAITKDGRPVAKLVPAHAHDDDRALMGSVTLIAEDDEAYFSTGEVWNAERGVL